MQWQFSNWQTYTGAAIGGAIGGVISIYNPVAGFAAGAAASTLIGQTLENVTSGGKKRSASNVVVNTITDGVIGGVTGKLLPVKAAGITSGKGNMGAVFKSGLKKIGNGNASKMSISVIKKGIISGIIGGLGSSLVSGYKNFLVNSFENSRQGNKIELPSGPLYWTQG